MGAKVARAAEERVEQGSSSDVEQAAPRKARELFPQLFRSAAAEFAEDTALTYDGLHPQHFLLKSDEALSVRAILLATLEALEVLPSHVRTAMTVFQGKPNG